MRARFLHEVTSLGLPAGPGPADPVTALDLSPLPEPARRYLAFMGVVGRPRDWSFRVGFTGRFRTRPDRAWMPCKTWQYNSRLTVARVFQIRLRLAGLVPVVARDTYLGGHGRMLVKLVDRITVADGTGAEYDTGELATYLNDAVLIAPSMLLAPDVIWSAVDAESFNVTLTDHGRTVAARVFIDERGAPRTFSTTDRFCSDPDDPKRLVRARWTTPIGGWQPVDGRQIPTRAEATWHLPRGPFTYADFRLAAGSLAFNLPPGR